jgi:hypothetical protein
MNLDAQPQSDAERCGTPELGDHAFDTSPPQELIRTGQVDKVGRMSDRVTDPKFP